MAKRTRKNKVVDLDVSKNVSTPRLTTKRNNIIKSKPVIEASNEEVLESYIEVDNKKYEPMLPAPNTVVLPDEINLEYHPELSEQHKESMDVSTYMLMLTLIAFAYVMGIATSQIFDLIVH